MKTLRLSSRGFSTPIIILGIVAIILVTGIVFYSHSSGNASSYKTYTSQDYSFEYPSLWVDRSSRQKGQPQQWVAFDGNTQTESFSISNNVIFVEEAGTPISTTSINLGGEQGVESVYQDPGTILNGHQFPATKSFMIRFSHHGINYQIDYSIISPYEASATGHLTALIASFKFLN